jgi:alpha-N-arabinofuranosidase
VFVVLVAGLGTAQADDLTIKISAQPMHDGRISPMLFGNFIELLDDLVPGMRAEMLNDRGFEGIVPAANWVYYDGSPTLCDRTWNANESWTIDGAGAFNGLRSARIISQERTWSALTQSGLAVSEGASYRFSGFMRAEGTLDVQARLEFKLPDGREQDLAVLKLERPKTEWTRVAGTLTAVGTTDRAQLKIRVRGAGRLWLDQVSLLPEQNRLGWRPDVVEVIKAARPAVIRWGGSVVDPGAYRWKGGIGDRDHRVPFRNTTWGRIDSNDVGIGEFCQFCELVAAAPLVCVSFSDGAASAADLVEYCNGSAETAWGARRADDGRPTPYKVKFWQLGNELSGDDDAYIRKCKDFIAAMKKVDPEIAILSSFPSQKVVRELGKDLSHLAPHHYTRDLTACEAGFQKLAKLIAATPGRGHLRLAVTEWNFTAGDWGLLRGKMLTLQGALWNAEYLNLMCRYANLVEIGCRSNMTNSYCSGIIGTTPSGLIKRPSYYVMKLYAEHAKPIPLRLTKAPEGLDLLACADKTSGEVCLFVVNLRRDPVKLTLDLSEFTPPLSIVAAEAVSDAKDRRQVDVMNDAPVPERVCTIPLVPQGNAIVLPALSACAVEIGRR